MAVELTDAAWNTVAGILDLGRKEPEKGSAVPRQNASGASVAPRNVLGSG